MTADEFHERAFDFIEWFLGSFTKENGLIRPADREDDPEEFDFVYTHRGQVLYENMMRRINKIAERKFPNEDFDFYTHLYQEL